MGVKQIPFFIIRGLAEQALLSNGHCQQLGFIKIREDKEKASRTPQIDTIGPFKLLIQKLLLSRSNQRGTQGINQLSPSQTESQFIQGLKPGFFPVQVNTVK